MVDQSSEFERVLALLPKEIVAPGKNILIVYCGIGCQLARSRCLALTRCAGNLVCAQARNNCPCPLNNLYIGPKFEGELMVVAVRLNENRAVFSKAGENIWFSEKRDKLASGRFELSKGLVAESELEIRIINSIAAEKTVSEAENV